MSDLLYKILSGEEQLCDKEVNELIKKIARGCMSAELKESETAMKLSFALAENLKLKHRVGELEASNDWLAKTKAEIVEERDELKQFVPAKDLKRYYADKIPF